MSNHRSSRDAYLDLVDQELSGLDFADRSSILHELADHYQDLMCQMRMDCVSSDGIHRQIWKSMGDPRVVGIALREENLSRSSSLWQAFVTGLPFLLLGGLLAQPVIHGEFWRLWGQYADPMMPTVIMGAMLAVAVGLFLRFQWSWLSTVIGVGAFLTVLPLTRLLNITSDWPLGAAWMMLCFAFVVPAAVGFTIRSGVQHTVVAILAGTGAYGVYALSNWVSGLAGIALILVPFLAIVLVRMARRRYGLLVGSGAILGVWGVILILPIYYYGATFGPIPALTQPPEYFPVRPVEEWISLAFVPVTFLLIVSVWLLLKIQDLQIVRVMRMTNMSTKLQRR